MDEAAEIAKLRLFLKLAAQLDDSNHIEPLPDLDFNIKSGNLLVGIAGEDDIKRRFSDRGVLPFGLDNLKDAAESIAAACKEFVAIQESTEDQHTLSQAKGNLQGRINAVTDQADRGLHKMRSETMPLEAWQETHNPFHWFAEFPTVWRNGGFDVIIGNPPYIGLSSKKRHQFDYKWIGYKTEKCPDIYAVCMERASNLLNNRGRFAMIVMHSLCFHKGFQLLRGTLLNRFPTLWVSSFSRSPDSLFAGSAKVRNTIIIAAKNGNSELYTSRCRRWFSKFREYLFNTQQYVVPSEALLQCGHTPQWPFVDEPSVVTAFQQMLKTQEAMEHSLQPAREHYLGWKKIGCYMLGAFIDPPPIITNSGIKTVSPHNGQLFFGDPAQRDLAFLCIAGRWTYIWWLIYGDEFHVTRGVLAALPCDIERLATSHHPPCDMELANFVKRLLALADQLKEEMPKHLAWQKNAGIKVGRYNMLKLRHITDEADWLLAQAWGLTREQYEAAGNLRDRMTFGNKD